MHELPGAEFNAPSVSSGTENEPEDGINYVVNAGLLSKIELLEAENRRLISTTVCRHFKVEQIQNNDRLFRFYTGFISYMVFLAFYEFLEPVIHELNYWGSKTFSSATFNVQTGSCQRAVS